MEIFMWTGAIVCVGLIAITIKLLYLNRSSETIRSKVVPAFVIGLIGIVFIIVFSSSETIWSKVVPAFAIGLMGIFFTTWFSTKGESFSSQFNYTLYFNKIDKKGLDEHYNKQHAYGGAQFDDELRNFIDKKLAELGLEKDGEQIEDLYFHLAFIKLSSRFYWLYANWWDIHINSVRRGDGFETVISANKPYPPCMSLKWNDLLETLVPNDSLCTLLDDFSQNFWIKEMTVPPKTKVGIETSKVKNTLSLKNPFVEISITFNKHGGSVGLGDYQWLLGYDNKKNSEFWSERFEVVCEAEFERLRSGHPEMLRYKKWVQTMFEEVRYQFDDERRLIRARDYRDLSSQRQLK